MNIIVLGGAGKMGGIAVQTLAQDPRVDQVVIADLNQDAARAVADYIGSPKIRIQSIDLRDHDALVRSLKDADAVVNATVYYTNLPVMEACIEARTPYVDLGGLFHTTRKQLELDERFKEAGVSAVLGMGSAPGVPNVQARYAADRLDTVEYIRIYDGIKPPPPENTAFTYAVATILDELTMKPMVYRQGKFIAMEPLSEFEEYQFTPPLGTLPMHLSLHSEVATLPLSFAHKGVQEVFFKINYWGMAPETVEKVRVLAEYGLNSTEPVEVKGVKVAPRDLMVALLRKHEPPSTDFLAPPANEPPDWTKEIVTEVKGTQEGQEVTYRLGTLTVKGALPTGASPAIIAIWLAEGRIPAGVHPPERVIDPEDFFGELRKLGIETRVTIPRPL